MIFIGHRGACGYAPENTLASFKKALELGVDAVELDVYVCASGQLVVIHDDTVDRTTGGHGRVTEMSFEQLRSLDAGSGQRIPTLEEVCDLVNRKVRINVELKGPGTAEPVAQLIERYRSEHGWSYGDFLVSSFNHHELKDFHLRCPAVEIGALITGIPLEYAEFATQVGASSANLCIEFINREFVEDAHGRGLKVYVWTVNEAEDVQRMAALGVDGVFSNFPDRVKR